VANSALQQSLQSTTQPGFIPLLLWWSHIMI
jgi:hypothetical protein